MKCVHIQSVFFPLFSIIVQNVAYYKGEVLNLRPKRESHGQLLRRLSPANPCLLKCKDNYMMSSRELPSHGHRTAQNWKLDNAIGSPMQALVEIANDENAIGRLDFECSCHANFVSCLGQCGTSPAAQILLQGQETLKIICRSFKGEREFIGSVLPCLARNGAQIGNSCQLHWSLLEKDIFESLQSKTEQDEQQKKKHLEEGLRQICRALNSYADCHLRTVAQLCHRRALSFFVQLNAKSSAALLRLLVGWAVGRDPQSVSPAEQWPDECTQWNLGEEDAFWSNGGSQNLPLLGQPTIGGTFFVALCFIFTIIL